MSISSEITRISDNVSDALDAIESKGVTIPTGANSDDLPSLISSIRTGSSVVVTPTLLTGTDIASISVDGSSTTLYAPTPPTPSSATPQDLGTASSGSSTDYSRADHVHNYPDIVHVGSTAPTDSNIELWLDNSSGGGSIVSSVDGKTGVVTVLPSGGTTGQVLKKVSNTSYDVAWANESGGSGSGTVTQITFNGDVFSDDGTGNVPMTVDAEDVGAIADPSTKSDGQVLTWDSNANAWVAANPSTGNVNTVNNVGVTAGTTNIDITGANIPVSGSDNTPISSALSAVKPISEGGTGGTTQMTAARNLGALDLYLGSEIPDNTDLNDYTTPGVYYSSSAGHSATMLNVPTTSAGFKLVVGRTIASTRVFQIAILNDGVPTIYKRYYNDTWSAWIRSLDESWLPLSVSRGGTGGTDAATALANLGGAPLLTVNNTANTTYTFSVNNSSRFVLITIAAHAASMGLYFFNTTSAGAITRADVFAASEVSFTNSANILTVTSARTGTFGIFTLNGAVSLST